ncbi:CcdC protein domain-containing protein [Bacillus sp. S13(2024)]|uniref:CcdC protein domain-containing protein n=1 Tax=unclassified Bacillus (in: firmicutes) TaxID=185979 RepID=UPI003D24CE60
MVNGNKCYYVLYLLLPSIPINLNPKIHAAGWEWICALIFGFLLSIPLIRTTNYELRSDQHIFATKNRSFVPKLSTNIYKPNLYK